jgi:uncharacterized lipoprotein YehR (DUF1307 family)
MKTKMKVIAAILFTAIAISNTGCGKKEEVPAQACKTCKAFGAGIDGQTIQKEVCTPEEEKAFRNEHTGVEISCQ